MMRRLICSLFVLAVVVGSTAKQPLPSPWAKLHAALKGYVDKPSKRTADAFVKAVQDNRSPAWNDSEAASYDAYLDYVGSVLNTLEKAIKGKDPIAVRVGLYLCDASPDIHLVANSRSVEASAIIAMPETFLVEAAHFKGDADVPLGVVVGWDVEGEEEAQACEELKEREKALKTVINPSLQKLRDSFLGALQEEMKGTCAS